MCHKWTHIIFYVIKYLKKDMKEIAEYELFDIDNEGEYQTAKIKISKLA